MHSDSESGLSDLSDPQLEPPGDGSDGDICSSLNFSVACASEAGGAEDASDPPIVKRRRLEPILRTPAELERMAGAARGAVQMREAVRNRETRVRAARPVAKAKARPRQGNRGEFNAAFFQSLGHSVWFIPCDQAHFHRAFHVIGMFFCGNCGAHGFRPPCKRLQVGCEGPARTTAQRRVLAQLRSGYHPDSRPPTILVTPDPFLRTLGLFMILFRCCLEAHQGLRRLRRRHVRGILPLCRGQ